VHGLDVDEVGVAEALEMEANGVRMKAEAVGEVVGRQRRGRSGELSVEGEAGLVAERFENSELIHSGLRLTVAPDGHIFKTTIGFIGSYEHLDSQS